MEALSSSTVPSRVVKAVSARQPTSPTLSKISACRSGCARAVEKFESLRLWKARQSATRSGLSLRAAAHEVSWGFGEEDGAPGSGLDLVADEDLSGFEGNLVQNGSHASGITELSEMAAPATFGSGASGSKAGLFRTPISGGVQSATSVHDLPRPALAVRNLMEQEWAYRQFKAKHQQWASQQWGNFYYYRMNNISDIYFIGGFGTVAWVDVKEYEALQPDKIAVDGGEQNLKELNAMFSKSLKEILSTEMEIDDAAFISVDSKGTDIRVRQGAQFNIQRLPFKVEHGVETLDEAKAALKRIIDEHSRSYDRS